MLILKIAGEDSGERWHRSMELEVWIPMMWASTWRSWVCSERYASYECEEDVVLECFLKSARTPGEQ